MIEAATSEEAAQQFVGKFRTCDVTRETYIDAEGIVQPDAFMWWVIENGECVDTICVMPMASYRMLMGQRPSEKPPQSNLK